MSDNSNRVLHETQLNIKTSSTVSIVY